MPWHERWFYEDWLIDELVEAASDSGQSFDAKQPWSGGHLGPDVAAGLGIQTREI